MKLENERLILRSMQERDIDDIIYWNTIETEWMLWDAPWERENDKEDWEDYRRRKTLAIQQQDDSILQRRLEVCLRDEQQTHIGAISCYFMDEEYRIDEQGKRLAIGMDIYERKYRGSGYGTSAYRLYMDYLKSFGYTQIYTQTWSGNLPLLAMAKRLGFQECNRYIGLRKVRGEIYDGLTLVKVL